MTDTVLISLVGASATVLVSVVNATYALIGNARGIRNEGHLVENKAAIAAIRVQTDGMTDRIATLAGEKGVLEGHAQGLADAAAVPADKQRGLL